MLLHGHAYSCEHGVLFIQLRRQLVRTIDRGIDKAITAKLARARAENNSIDIAIVGLLLRALFIPTALLLPGLPKSAYHGRCIPRIWQRSSLSYRLSRHLADISPDNYTISRVASRLR